jgi:hypothetical protein
VIPFTLRRYGDDHVTITVDDGWMFTLKLDRVWAANLAAELDAWLAGTDQLPETEYRVSYRHLDLPTPEADR